MARKKTPVAATPTPTPTSPAQGQTFWLDSKIRKWERDRMQTCITCLGGAVQADIDASLNYLVLADNRRGTTCPAEKKAAKVGGAITTIYADALHTLLCPSRELALHIIAGGPANAAFWEQVQPAYTTARIDLDGVRFSHLDLSGFRFAYPLDGVQLDGCKLDGTRFQQVKNLRCEKSVSADGLLIGDAEDCDFDGLSGKIACHRLLRCSFRGAKLAGSVFAGAYRLTSCDACDFSDADLSEATFNSFKSTGLQAPRANFTRAILDNAGLEKADLQKAKFHQANLRGADLSGANLRGADFTGANLSDANLKNADITGADFTGANLRGANLDGLDRTKAKGLDESARSAREPGPILGRLITTVAAAKGFNLTFTLVSPTRGFCKIQLVRGSSYNTLQREESAGHSYLHPATWDGALLDLRDEWSDAVPDLDSIQAKLVPTNGTIQTHTVQALCELFDQPIPDTAEVATARKKARGDRLTETIAGLRKKGGVSAWNKRPALERRELGQFAGVDLSKAKLTGVDLSNLSLSGANLSGADLRQANLSRAICVSTNLQKANLEGADLRGANLEGADLTEANLKGVRVEETFYDEKTQFPAGFAAGEGWKYVGKKPPPAVLVAAAPQKEMLDFPTFFIKLKTLADPGRIKNAVSMLRSEKFSLFAETTETQVIGVVRSQSSSERVYACRLASNGQFECGTQNMRPCGGLAGQVCKHLLVLIVGLTKGGALDGGSAFQWLQLSQRQGPTFDKETMTTTFLRYKGVEAGEVDWRPTETVPEDYYAL